MTPLFPENWCDRTALILEPSGVRLSFGEIEAQSNQVAHLLREFQLNKGDTVAIVMENRAEFLVIAWAAQRSGLYYVGVNSHLTASEAQYIIEDSGAAVVFASATTSSLLGGCTAVRHKVLVDDPAGIESTIDWEPYDLDRFSTVPIENQSEGDFLLYSSGTTGRPKGIQRALPGGELGTYVDYPGMWLTGLLGFLETDIYLCPAPLYHAAPLGWSMGVHRQGATVVLMERFDAVLALEFIERHKVTHSQWVPTMFVRMLKLSDSDRTRFDLSSHRVAVHASAPCPAEVKLRMIDWWGPILFEFYSSTEGVGVTSIFSDEWLTKPGSVGKPILGTPVILDEDGLELPSGEVGTIWFSGGPPFEYRGDPGKTAATIDSTAGRASVGDLGHLDEDGFLFLSDRRAHLIISGGVNIYPQEIEDALIMHPEVLDVAVAGVPDEEMGERVCAFVLRTDSEAGEVQDLENELATFCRTQLAGFKIPREFRFVSSLPRTPTGKLQKHRLPITQNQP